MSVPVNWKAAGTFQIFIIIRSIFHYLIGKSRILRGEKSLSDRPESFCGEIYPVAIAKLPGSDSNIAKGIKALFPNNDRMKK